ncbi:MAG TPA: type VI secretion system ATPase TssH [Candidatus Binatia bacterium]|nr:type VI secretion system ATPase TssH [Candidatus Binatia bacterium]
MAEISRRALFAKLGPVCDRTIRSAFEFCRLRGNPYIEMVHWVNQILQSGDSDFQRIVRKFGLDESRLARDLTNALDALPRGAGSVSDFSAHVEESIERAWVWGSLAFGHRAVRSGHLVVALLKTPNLRGVFCEISPEFRKIKVDDLIEQWASIVSGSPEESITTGAETSPSGEEEGAPSAAPMGKQEALSRFTVDMTEQAKLGKIDPVVGRDREIRQVVDILSRRRQNNPILTGEAGVGKTAVVEGLALRIACGDVPPSLKGVSLRALDVGLLQAGAGVKGEFEKRLRQVIEEVQSSDRPIILFIDETHTLVGAGGQAGTGDAANLLKPALARGTLRTIGATTWSEYKKYIEKDPALTRRFQAVSVGEPDIQSAVSMMRCVAGVLSTHHRVLLRDDALEAAVKLSHRYVPARRLPDKAVSLLDTACARVALSQNSVPAAVEDNRRRIEALTTEKEILQREQAVGLPSEDRLSEVESRLASETEALRVLEERWANEKKLVDDVLELRRALHGNGNGSDSAEASEGGDGSAPSAGSEAGNGSLAAATAPSSQSVASAQSGPANAAINGHGRSDVAEILARLAVVEADLRAMQGETPMVLTGVDSDVVASVVADWTGIPVGRMVQDEITAVLELAPRLAQRIRGQDHALEMIARRVQTSRANLDNPTKPVGVFLLAGPSGVGKTETALALAEQLYGGEHNVITINMSEFQEAHTVSTLKGAPPGYKGYEEGGVLTEAVRRRPHSVVLLDEVEKAHPDVHEIFFQVFDKGIMEDGSGTLIDFRNTLIILTSNVGTDVITAACDAEDEEARPSPEELTEPLRRELLQVFPPALLGRVVTIPYYPLSDTMLREIVGLHLGRIAKRVEDGHAVPFTYDPGVVDLIVQRCTEVESGGRMVDAILTNTVLPELSRELLTRFAVRQGFEQVHVGVSDGELTYDFGDPVAPVAPAATLASGG